MVEEKEYDNTLGGWIDRFDDCNNKEDFEKYYKDYWKACEKTICKENNILAGGIIPTEKVYKRVTENLKYLIEKMISPMRSDFVRKVWWFLYL
jgi:hypothetical protein